MSHPGIRIPKNHTDPTGSGSATKWYRFATGPCQLLYNVQYIHYIYIYHIRERTCHAIFSGSEKNQRLVPPGPKSLVNPNPEKSTQG